jgi:hypothetical protein
MIEIIQQKRRRESVEYNYEYLYKDDPGSGFFFPCDEGGTIDTEDLHPAALENLKRVLDDPGRFIDKGVSTFRHEWWEPAVGRCYCGRSINLDGFTNTCACGREFNWAGQELAPRRCWGEETGEHPADLGRIE